MIGPLTKLLLVTYRKRRNSGFIHGAFLLFGLLASLRADSGEHTRVVPLQAEPERSLSVRLSFNEQAAWFMFDTGAGAHTLARWFIDTAGIEADESLSESIKVRDATGEPVEVRLVKGQAGVLPNGEPLAVDTAIVATFPPELEKLGIGGLLNPQLLASSDRAVVLDLRAPELRLEPFSQAVRRLGAEILDHAEVQRCVDTDTPVPNLLYSVRVTTGSGNSGWLQLDTGARVTSIAASSRLVASLDLQPGGETMGISGRRQTYSVAPGLTLRIGPYRTAVDAEVIERSSRGCGPDGLLGRDALGPCALVFGDESVALLCNGKYPPAGAAGLE